MKIRTLTAAIGAVAVAAIAYFTDHGTAMILATAAVAVTEEQLAEIVTKFKKATDDVQGLGKQILDDAEAGRKTSAEIKAKADEALTLQGELKQRMTELEQALAKGLKNLGGSPENDEDTIGSALEKAYETDAFKALKGNWGELRGKTISVPLSRKALTNSGVTGTALTYPGDRVLAAPLPPLQRRLTIRDLLAPGRTNSPVIFYGLHEQRGAGVGRQPQAEVGHHVRSRDAAGAHARALDGHFAADAR
jgi:hypothetical protein